MPEISKITLPNSNTYDIKDATARTALTGSAWDSVAREAISGGVSFIVASSAATTPKGVSWNDGTSTITGTLEAADATVGAFYLVKSSTAIGSLDVYDEYVPVTSGGSKTWEKIGDTQADMSTKADKGGAITVSSISGTAASAKTNISLSSHSVSLTLAEAKITAAGTNAASAVTISPTTTDIYSMTSAGSVTAGTANTPTVIDTTKFSGGSYSHTGFSGGSGSFTQGTFTPNTPTELDLTKFNAGSFTRGSFSGGSGSFTQGTDTYTPTSYSVSDETMTITAGTFTQGKDTHTHTAATHAADSFTAPSLGDGFYTKGTAASHGADSHTHTGATYGTDSFTAASLGTGFYTAGTAGTPTAVTLPGRSTAIKAWTGYNTGVANTYAAAQTFTGTEVSSTNMKSETLLTIADHTITDSGHTHSVTGTGSGTINS